MAKKAKGHEKKKCDRCGGTGFTWTQVIPLRGKKKMVSSPCEKCNQK